MTNLEKYENSFIESFELTKDQLPSLRYQGIQAWDSVGHMALCARIEGAFDIMMEPDDIVDLSSFEKGREILAAKYNIDFNA